MRIQEICETYGIALCYLFGSQKQTGETILKEQRIECIDFESDIDFAVSFITVPEDALNAYARLSLDLDDIVSPFKADLVFLHEVDHLIQLEAINGINVYALDEELKDSFELKVMALAADESIIFKLNERDFLEAIGDGYFEIEYKADRR